MALSERDCTDKLTIRLPRDLLDALRSVAEATGWSLNTVAVQAMRGGWPQVAESGEPTALLASRTTRPASKTYDPEAFARRIDPLRPNLEALGRDLDWVRSDR